MLAVCLAGSGALAQQDSLVISSTAVGLPGDTVTVTINMANHSDSVSAMVMLMTFNNSVFQSNFQLIGPGSRIPPQWTTWDTVQQNTIRILYYDFFSQYRIPVGTGEVVQMRFVIRADVPNGTYPVRFDRTDTTNNALSSWDGRMMFPRLIDGSIRVTGSIENNPPYFSPPLPASVSGEVNQQIQFNVNALDPEGNAITLTAQNLPSGATFTATGGSGQFQWTPSAQGSYNVYFTASDGFAETRDTVIINVGIVGNQAPIISPIPAQVVAEGDHLEFSVTATDPEGQFLSLEAINLPANSSFQAVQGNGIVSSTFYFDPDYSQGPDTISVTFTARDAFNNVTNQPVIIIILDAPNDFLEVRSGQGALPGSLGRSLAVSLRNARPLYGLQFDLIYDPTILDIYHAHADSSRAYDLAFDSRIIDDGRYRIIIYSFGLDSIKAGSGDIVAFDLDVANMAPVGPLEVTFDSATSVQDSLGGSMEILFFPGTFIVDRLGDANLDGIVSVGDCVAIVAHLLSWITLSVRGADAADYSRDGEVRIADLMFVVNHIMHRPINPEPPGGLAGEVEILRDGLYPGFKGDVPMWLDLNTEAAAVQFTVEYNPAEVRFNGLTAGSMISDLRLDYHDSGSEVDVVIYDFNLETFGPSIGELVNLDIETVGDRLNPATALRLTDFEIVNVDAYTMNVDVLGELPTQFVLNQNYPNPFNSSTVISFEMPGPANVRLTVYNVLGQVVAELLDGYLDAGLHQLTWDGTGRAGENVTSGIYFYRLQADSFEQTKKMLLVK